MADNRALAGRPVRQLAAAKEYASNTRFLRHKIALDIPLKLALARNASSADIKNLRSLKWKSGICLQDPGNIIDKPKVHQKIISKFDIRMCLKCQM